MEFELAGPSGPAVDMDRIVQASVVTGPYRVISGDSLRLELPAVLYPGATAGGGVAQGTIVHNCRIDDEGAITLLDGQRLLVAGRTLAEIEATVADVYYPDLISTRPSVYAQILEYTTYQVKVLGAVAQPGVHRLRHDQMFLVALLMQAGGITDSGAAVIRIARPAQAERILEPDSSRRSFQIHGHDGSSLTAAGLPEADAASGAVPPPRVRFRRELPLNTTGSLAVEYDGQIVFTKWLDVRSVAQRDAFVQATSASLGEAAAAMLRARLVDLGRILHEGGLPSAAEETIPYRGWEVTPAGDWETVLDTPSFDHVESDHLEEAPAMRQSVSSSGKIGTEPPARETVVLPVRGLNIPLRDVGLNEGDTVVVERPPTMYVSVLGLVGTPGTYPYPSDVRYNLAQTLGLAGGLDMVAEPRFVSVYRLDASGEVVSANFRFIQKGKRLELTEALALEIKPGDVIDVMHTPRTRKNVFLDRFFRINLGLYLRPEELWEP
jgi:protein involved in polysaccharide export with SLBB domain